MNDRNKSYFVHESSYIDENVEIEDISKLKNIYKNILKNYFN